MLHPDHETSDDRNLANSETVREGRGGPQCVVVRVHGESDVGSARRAAARVAISAGVAESDAGAFALIVTEAATNVARYGREGFIVVRDARHSGAAFVEMIAVDKGPGIADMSRALADGYSSGGTPGKGLGAIRRMSQELDIWTAPGSGTALVARIAIRDGRNQAPGKVGVVCTALGGDAACGDAWLVEKTAAGTLIALVDGLGHGSEAAKAADAAIGTIRRRKNSSIAEMFQLAHGALRSTRGAAVQIAIIDSEAGTLRSAGYGNISMSVITHDLSKSVPSHPGIVGHQMGRLHEVTIPWSRDSLLVTHTDGLSARWRLESYPGIRLRDPALAAAVLYRDFARERDDATVLTFRDAEA